MKKLIAALLCVVCFLFVGCKKPTENSDGGETEAYSYSVYLSEKTIFVGETTSAVALLYNEETEVNGVTTSFSVNNASVCSIDALGVIKAISVGTATITGKADYNGKTYEASETLTVTDSSVLRAESDVVELTIGAEPLAIKVGAFYNGENITDGFSYKIADDSCVGLNENNTVYAKTFGETTLEISYKELKTSVVLKVDTMNIYTTTDFLKIGDNLDKNFVLQNDITFTEAKEFGFGIKNQAIDSSFSGVFDGNGHCVTAQLNANFLKCDFENNEAYYGVVFAQNHGTIKNTAFRLSTASGWDGYKLLALVGTNYGKIENVLLYGEWGANAWWDIGGAGLVARNIGDVKNCIVVHNLKNLSENASNAVDIVGAGYYKENGNSTIENCGMLVLSPEKHSGNKKIENVNDDLFPPKNCFVTTQANELSALCTFAREEGWADYWDWSGNTLSFGSNIICEF